MACQLNCIRNEIQDKLGILINPQGLMRHRLLGHRCAQQLHGAQHQRHAQADGQHRLRQGQRRLPALPRTQGSASAANRRAEPAHGALLTLSSTPLARAVPEPGCGFHSRNQTPPGGVWTAHATLLWLGERGGAPGSWQTSRRKPGSWARKRRYQSCRKNRAASGGRQALP